MDRLIALGDISPLESFDPRQEIASPSSFPLPSQSEPPDVRIWFSSYKYESPSQEDSCVVELRLDSFAHEADGDERGRDCDFAVSDVSNVEVYEGQEDAKAPELHKLISGEDPDAICLGLYQLDRLLDPYMERLCDREVKRRGNAPTIEKLSAETCSDPQLDQVKSFTTTSSEWVSSADNRGPPFDFKEKLIHEDHNEQKQISTQYIDQNQLKSTTIFFPKELSVRKGRNCTSTGNLQASGSPQFGSGGSATRSGKEKSIENCGVSWVSTRRYEDRCGGAASKRNPSVNIKCAASNSEENSLKRRAALADKTNQVEVVAEKPEAPVFTGKWQCPSKKKPYSGPPLKQLRLERWVRRAI